MEIIKPKSLDGRNIKSEFYNWTNEQIKTNLDTKRHNFSLLLTNINGDFNVSTCIRNSNAFLAKEVFIYGKKKYDKRGSVGTYWYENLNHVSLAQDLDPILSKFDCIVALDNIERSKPIESYKWDKNKNTLIILGEEHYGVPQNLLDISHDVLMITQYGSVRSINVGSACAIACYDYLVKTNNF